MKKLLLLTKTLLAAALLCVGQNAWGATETLSGADTGTKDQPIAKTSFTLLGDYKPDDGSRTINTKSCMKVRWNKTVASTGNAEGFALKVNAGYMITKVVAQFSGNGKALTLGDIVIDGNNYAGSYTTTVPSNDSYAEITLSGITATDYINFTKASGDATQGYVYITATYVKVNQWDFTDSGIWGSITLPTAESNTKNYQYNGVEGTALNYVTFYSTGAKLVHPTTATNGIGFSTEGSTSDNYVKISVPAGYTAVVTANCTSNRNLKVNYNGVVSPAFTDVVQTQEFANTTGGSLDLYIYCTQYAGGASKQPWLKKIELKQTFQVTTNYVDEESNVIKTATVENVVAGSTYSTTYDANYYVSNTDPYKYTYVSGAASGVTINEAKEYTVVYHKGDRASYKLNVTQSYGSKSQKIVNNQTIYEGASYTYYYPRFILDGTTLYDYASSTDPGANASYWYSTISNMSANRDYTLTYNAKDGVCVYYSEGENVSGKSGAYTYANWRNGMSNGSSGVFSSDTKLITLGAGNYTVTARVNGRASDRYVDIAKTSNTEENRIIHAVSANYGNESSAEFSLTGSTDIVVNGGYVSSENGHGLDYVYIMKTSEVATIGSNGFTTFASPYPLDLTSDTQTANSFKAYRASTVNSTTATFKDDVNQNVVANTGILLKGTANATITIPVVASGTALADNALLVNASGNTFAAAANTTYYGMNKDSDPLTFGTFNPSSVAIPANKAYLALTSIAARSIIGVFDDITAVENVEVATEAKAKEGKFIENGKLVIVKNGVKYNAAGAKLY